MTVTVGKARDNDLVIDDPTVSRRHFSTFHAEAGFEVRDLESTSGVFVGSTRIREALVEPGTVTEEPVASHLRRPIRRRPQPPRRPRVNEG